ncbi:glycosyltransferase family 2 protein [Patescibacteria group bacterium]
MLLSIIIVSFNTKKVLKKCLESLCLGCSGLAGRWEVVIVDNNSQDGSQREIKNQISKSKNPNQRLKVSVKAIFNKKNWGFAKAVNQGIKKSAGKYILLLNSDIICLKKSLTKLVQFASKRKKIGLVGGKLLYPGGQGQASVYHLPTAGRAIREFWLGQKGAYLKYLPQSPKPVRVEAVVGAVMLIPRSTIEQIGCLDEAYFMYFEDLDFCRRLKKAGLAVYYLPAAQFIHFHGQSGKKSPGKVTRFLVRSSKLYFGRSRYWLVSFILWTGQKWRKTWGKK